MHPEMVWDLFKIIKHNASLCGIPERLDKSCHIPGLRLEIIMSHRSKNPENYDVEKNTAPEHLFFGKNFHQYTI